MFAFDSQQRHAADFVQSRAGEAVRVECTYENATGNTVSFVLCLGACEGGTCR